MALSPLAQAAGLLTMPFSALRFASMRTCEYRESMARETCPAMLMITSSPAPDSGSSVTSMWRLRFWRRLGISSHSGGGLQITPRGTFAPEQGEDVAAENMQVRFVGCQPNRLREVL